MLCRYTWHDCRLTCVNKFPNEPIKLRKALLLPPIMPLFCMYNNNALFSIGTFLGLAPRYPKAGYATAATHKCTNITQIHNKHIKYMREWAKRASASNSYISSGLKLLHTFPFITYYTSRRALRSQDQHLLQVPRTRTQYYGSRTFSAVAPTLWNSLPLYIRTAPTMDSFKRALKQYLFTTD